jgi:DnaJ-class molecular chaperone
MAHTMRPMKAELSKVRAIMVAVDCDACDGTGKVYASESARHATICPRCDGDAWVTCQMDIDGLRQLLPAPKP